MANVSITQLPLYSSVISTTGDVVPIVDITNNTTKKISVLNLLSAVPQIAVRSVGLVAPTPFVVSGSPVTNTGNLQLAWGSGQIPAANLGLGTPSATTFLRGDNQWVPLPPSGVTSIGLTMPQPFLVTNSPITTNGNLNVSFGTGQIPPANLGAGAASSTVFLAGDGIWRSVGGSTGIGTVTSITAGIGLGAPTSGAAITTTGTINLLPPTGANIGGVSAGTNVTISAAGVLSVPTATLDSVLSAGNTTTQGINVGSGTVGAAPTLATDIVRLQDLQLATQVNVNFRAPVALVATSSVGTTYTNNTGVNTATVTGTGTLTIDGVIPFSGQRVLLINQGALTGAAVGVSNGSYVVTTATDPWTLTRTNDPLGYGNYHFVTGGSTLINNSYILNTGGTITVGTTPISYVQFATNPAGAANNPPASGTPTVGTSTRFAREDHIHPFSVTTAAAAATTSLTYDSTSGVLTFTPATPGAGAVSSVGLAMPADVFAVTGSPVTSTGTLTVGWGTGQIPAANLGAGTPGSTTFLAGDQQWRTIVTQVSASGVTPLNLTVTSPTSTPSIAASWGTGQIPVANLATGTADATRFVRGDGAWSTAVTSVGVTSAAPISLAVTNASTTPTIALTWGTGQIPVANLGSGTVGPALFLAGDGAWKSAVTSVALDVSGASALQVTGSPITGSGTFAISWGTGLVPVSNLGTGVSSTKFLRGDGTWQDGGTVSSVALAAPAAFTVTGSPVTSTGTLTLAWGTGTVPVANLGTGTPSTSTFLRGDGSWQAAGTVTSVGLSLPATFTVSNSPVTSSGTLTAVWNSGTYVPQDNLGSGTGTSSKVLFGDNSWGGIDLNLTSNTTGLNSILAKTTGQWPLISGTSGGLELVQQSANSFFSGPQDPAATNAYPTFRTIKQADIAGLGATAIGDLNNSFVPVAQSGGAPSRAVWSRILNYTALQSTPTVVNTATVGAGTLSINLANGALVSVTLSGTTTLSFTSLSTVLWDSTKAITVAVYHSGTGTTNFINSVTGVGAVRWRGGTAPTAGTTSDFYQFTILSPTGPCLASYTAW